MDYKEYWQNNTFDMSTRVNNFKKELKIKVADSTYIRLGSANDGGYILADDIAPTDYVVSFGVDVNVDFEKSLTDAGCHADMYDYSVSGPPIELPNSKFFKEKIGIDGGTTSLSSCLDKAGNKDIILKIDIEGAEWDVLSTANPKDLSKCRQILVEYHWTNQLQDLSFYTKAVKALKTIRKTHFPVWVHANNNVPLMVLGNSPVPMVFEALYLNKDRYSFTEFLDPFTELSTKNDVNFPEIGLSFP